jgi:hypothetical protein
MILFPFAKIGYFLEYLSAFMGIKAVIKANPDSGWMRISIAHEVQESIFSRPPVKLTIR